MDNLFPIFLQSNYPKFNADISKDERGELWVGFSEYLEGLSEEVLSRILPKGLTDVILNVDNPLRHNGWHPALIIHFNQYIESLTQKIES